MEHTLKVVSFDATRRRFGTAPNLRDWRHKPLAATWDERRGCFRIHVIYRGMPVVLHVDPQDVREWDFDHDGGQAPQNTEGAEQQ